MIKHEAMWHNIKENPNDLPTRTSWYVVKIKGSDDLKTIYGYQQITVDKYDAWMMIRCPY